MAKYYSCDVVSRVADSALRILGAYGCSSEYPVKRILRVAKLYQILEGSANIQSKSLPESDIRMRKSKT